MLRILIADDHDTVRLGLRNILEAHPDWVIVAEAADGKDAICMSLQTKPDIAVLDYLMPLINASKPPGRSGSVCPKPKS